jgi:hypothetical protein
MNRMFNEPLSNTIIGILCDLLKMRGAIVVGTKLDLKRVVWILAGVGESVRPIDPVVKYGRKMVKYQVW